MEQKEWNKLVKKQVTLFEQKRWKTQVAQKKVLEVYQVIKDKPEYESYLDSDNVPARRSMTILRVGNNPLRVCKGRQDNTEREDRLCCYEDCYEDNKVEDVCHILFHCRNPEICKLRNQLVENNLVDFQIPTLEMSSKVISADGVICLKKFMGTGLKGQDSKKHLQIVLSYTRNLLRVRTRALVRKDSS